MKKTLFSKYLQSISIYIILLLIIITYYIVYATGGTEFAFTHIMYIPIILGAFSFGIPGGFFTGLLAGIVLGPIMPLNVAQHIQQETASWMIRMVFFVVIGSLIGYLFQKIKRDRDLKIKKSFEHYLTGYPNQNKLKSDLNDFILAEQSFTLIIFKIVNLGYINRYVDDQAEKKTIFYVIEFILKYFCQDSLYCVSKSEYVLVFPGTISHYIRMKARKFLEVFDEPVLIDEMPIDLIVRSGIVNYPLHGTESGDLIKKLEITLDQDKNDDSKISVYQNSIAEKNKENYELIVALYDAVRNDGFSIVYQPKIDLHTNSVMGFEALLRWAHHTRGNINPEQFIPLAEQMGFINEITKWVIKNVIAQLERWKEEGVTINAAVNISSKDLRDNSIIQYTKTCMESSQVEPGLLEFELTERTIVENENNAGRLLNDISNFGLSISLDDFGTGYNSFIHLIKLPIDYVKLDKLFISSMGNGGNKLLVQGVINTVHMLGMKIIAEGVETEEQANILRKLGCDIIQGYYYSKPLVPDDVKGFIDNFNAGIS